MSAFVTDQFRIFNAGNFVDSVLDTNNSYYVFLGLSNPTSPSPGFGRTSTWNDAAGPPNPIDNFSYESQYGSTSLFGKRVVGDNIRRVVRKVEWTKNTYYDMYRNDYDVNNKAPNSGTGRLYDANYFVVNSDFNVYICIENGGSGVSGTTTSKGNQSEDEPTFTDLEPTAAGTSNDGYIWKFLFTISPSDIVKFDSTEYIVVPNDWATSTNSQIQSVREAGDSTLNLNQIKTVYIEDGGKGYAANTTTTVDIIGDGTGAKASVTSDGNGTISDIVVTAGGSGYTYGMVNLGSFGQPTEGFPAGSATAIPAKLIPIIPPSRGHGYDIYKELGADRVLVYARFDDSTKDFPTDTKFSQVGIVKNPSTYTSENTTFTGSQYSSLGAIKILNYSSWDSTNLSIGSTITQVLPDNAGTAKGYVASYDKQSGVLKYYQDRSLYYEQTNNRNNQTDYIGVGSDANSKQLAFGTSGSIKFLSTPKPTDASVAVAFTGGTMVDGTKEVDLGVYFTSGLANPEINKTTGDVIYIDNRKEVTRDSRQKEDIKIVLEF